jgi:hypothetical protein
MVQQEWSNRMNASILSWAAVAGNGHTDTSLASAAFNGRQYLFAKGILDGRVYVNTLGSDGRDWGNWTEVPGNGTTNAALDAVAFNNQLFLFLKGGVNGHVYMNRMSLSGSWSGWSEVPGNGVVSSS